MANMFLEHLYLCTCKNWKVTNFRFGSKFFALLPKFTFFVNRSTEGLLLIFLEEKGSKIVCKGGVQADMIFHQAKLKHKLLTSHVVPRLFKCSPLFFNIPDCSCCRQNIFFPCHT